MNKRYPDLLEEHSDPDLERLVADLETMSQTFTFAKMSPQRDAAIAHALREQAKVPEQRRILHAGNYRFPVRVPRRLAFVVIVLVSILILTSTAVARIPLLNQALSWYDTITQQTMHHQFGQTVNMSQSACGFTTTIQRIYADANDVVIGYTIKGPTARRFIGGFNISPIVTDSQGITYPMLGGGGTGTFNNETGNVLNFDAGGTTNHPKILELHFTAPVITTTEQIDNLSHRFAACETYRPLRKDEVPQSLDYTRMRAVTIQGPFTFDFTVPFSSGHEVDLKQVVESGGTKVTLERVVVTPIETRLYVFGVTQATDVNLVINGQTTLMSGSWSPRKGLVVYTDNDPLYDQHGTWKVIITSRPDLAKYTVGGAPVGGPWVFSFRMP